MFPDDRWAGAGSPRYAGRSALPWSGCRWPARSSWPRVAWAGPAVHRCPAVLPAPRRGSAARFTPGLHHAHSPGSASFRLTSPLACGLRVTVLRRFRCRGGRGAGSAAAAGGWELDRAAAGSADAAGRNSPATWFETHRRTNALRCYDNGKIYSSLKFWYFVPKIFLGKIFCVWLRSAAGKGPRGLGQG